MGSVENQLLFCRVCGSPSIEKRQKTDQDTSAKTLSPKFSLGPIGVGLSLDRQKMSSLSYQTMFCKLCYNIDVVDPSSYYSPLTIRSSKIFVILPYPLCIVLKSKDYSEQEIQNLISSIYMKLEDIERKWSQEGRSPCKHGKVGYELKLELKDDSNIKCWVIVDAVKDMLACRLAYGSREVSCP